MLIMLIMLGIFLFFMFIGVPVVFAIGLASLAYLFTNASLPLEIMGQRMSGSLQSFVLLALPCFLLSGRMMNSSGVTNRLFDFAIAVVGRFRGGLAHANALASMLFASMSGTAVGDTGGLGQVEISMMKKAGYSTDFAAGVTASTSIIGPVIPPSVCMVILGASVEISIGKLFMAGVIPGVLLGLSAMVYIYIKATFTKEGKSWNIYKAGGKELLRSFVRAIPPLLTPVIIIGGINSGIVTPTEAAVLAIDYAILLGIIYKELSFKTLWVTFQETLVTTGVFMFITAVAGFFSWELTVGGLPQVIASVLYSVTSNPTIILFIISAILLVVGCFLDTTASILLVAPIMMPVVTEVGIDPIHFGLVFIVSIIIGAITPPFGMCLFVVSDVAEISVERVTKSTIPYVIPYAIVLLLVIFIPQLSTWLPTLFF
jgi:tripartite ATP-independent transporter DctM subunit